MEKAASFRQKNASFQRFPNNILHCP